MSEDLDLDLICRVRPGTVVIKDGVQQRRCPCSTEVEQGPSASDSPTPEPTAPRSPAPIGARVGSAMKSGAIIGGAVGGGISALTNIAAVVQGGKDGVEALIDVAADTGAAAASSAAVSGVAVLAEAGLVRIGAGGLAAGAAPVAAALVVVDVGKDLGRLVSGDIDGAEFAGRTLGHAAKGGTTWAGMEGGAWIGVAVAGPAGAVVGGIVGGIVGGLFGGWLTR